MPNIARPDISAYFFVVETSRSQLTELVGRIRSGRLRTFVGDVVSLDKAAAAFSTKMANLGKIIVGPVAD
jgi:NADPH:quinone reductase-like Zn-dependent oxidoreductase